MGLLEFDIATLVMVNAGLGLVAAIMLSINWWMNPKVAGTKEWSLTLWCWALSMLLIIPRGTLSPLITVVLANGFVIIGSFYMLAGLSHYHNKARIPRALEFAIILAMLFGFYYFYLVESSTKYRLLLLTSFSAIAKFAALYLLIPTIKRFSAIGIVMAIGFLIHALFFSYNAIRLGLISGSLELAQINQATILLLLEVFLFMLWFTVSASMLTNIVLQRDLKRLANRDPLTGLLNRRSLFARCERLLRNSSNNNLSVLVLDLDHFKVINDTYGHNAGDEVLQHFVKTVTKELRENDIFGRTGGEEFLIGIHEGNEQLAASIADRICEALRSSPLNYQGININYSVSIGHASSVINNSDNLRELILAADKAMYHAKNNGRNRVESYNNLSEQNSYA